MTDHHAAFAARGLAPTDPIPATVDVDASASDVWAAIVERGNLTNIHPFCERNPVERWPGPDGLDHVHYYSGLHYQRDVLEWREGEGYDLAVGPPEGKLALASWTITPTDDTHCVFGIEVTSFVRTDADEASRARYVADVIGGAIPPYLDSVVRGVAHFAQTGDPVVRNQFGDHPLYSPS